MAYSPKSPPTINTLEELRQWVEEELRSISKELHSMSDVDVVQFNVISKPPARLIEGMVAFADGVTFQPPLLNRGLHQYESGVWKKL